MYDAVNYEFDVTQDLANIGSVLPFWEGDVPKDSCVWVGYTAATYKDKNGKWNLVWNIRHAVVIGVPASDDCDQEEVEELEQEDDSGGS